MRTVTLYNTPPVPSELVEKAGGAVPIHIQFIPYAKALWKDDPEWQKLLTAVNRKESVSGTLKFNTTVPSRNLRPSIVNKAIWQLPIPHLLLPARLLAGRVAVSVSVLSNAASWVALPLPTRAKLRPNKATKCDNGLPLAIRATHFLFRERCNG